MAQTINTNIMSLNAQRNLNQSQASLATSMQRLSSGMRINSAKDDAAGMAISERMTTQIRGLNQGVRNANDGISLVQTAEGAMGATIENLQRIRELAVQSANATNTASDRAALQAEVAQRVAEIDRVGNQTNFNGVKLLNGSFTSQLFQVGANANESVTVSGLVDARSGQIGSNVVNSTGTRMNSAATGATVGTTGGTLTVTTNLGTANTIAVPANSGADAFATAINAAGGGIGVSATATNSAVLSGISAGTFNFNLNGTTISGQNATSADLTAMVQAINGAAGSTGVMASFTDGNTGSITLSTTDGRNIALQNNAALAGAQAFSVAGGNAVPTAVAVAGVNPTTVVGSVQLSSTAGTFSLSGAAATDFGLAGSNTSSLTSVSGINISTSKGSTDALSIIDGALATVNSTRATLGAIQNRFETTVNELQTRSENLSASRSRIKDADFAQETANLSRAQILQQAGTAMLAQANQAPQGVLSLLKG